MSTAIPGEVWRPTAAEQVQHWALSKKLEIKGTLLDEHTGGRPKMNAEFGSEWDTLYYVYTIWTQPSARVSLLEDFKSFYINSIL
jgi:hypothetical protein